MRTFSEEFVLPPANDAYERAAILERTRTLKMASSAHAYVRGNTVSFYEWLQEGSDHGVPEGPQAWICGDCHLGNLGPIASADGRVDIQIRDLDQTVIGNPAHDLIRLGLSLASAARGSDLPGVTTAHMMEEMMAGYALSLADPDEEGAVAEPNVVKSVRRRSLGRRWRHLARERIADASPVIPRGRKFWELTEQEHDEVRKLLAQENVRRLVLNLNSRCAASDFDVVDAAYWMKGCSSLGLLRFAVVVRMIDAGRKDNLALIDIKEATAPAAPSTNASEMPVQEGERVVAGARALSPNLGERMVAATLLDRPVFVRELAPQDLKLEVDQFSRAEAVSAARYLAYVVGRAHGRQLAAEDRKAWRRELNRQRTDVLDAPNWLWSSVVGLAARHEEAYLHHCRSYALAAR